MYMKELSLTLSRSYGPEGTTRSMRKAGSITLSGMSAGPSGATWKPFLDLLAAGQIDVTSLLEHRYTIEDGAKAFADLKNGLYTAILEYNGASAVSQRSTPAVVAPRPRLGDEVRVGCIGAGSFASSVIFPNLQSSRACACNP